MYHGNNAHGGQGARQRRAVLRPRGRGGWPGSVLVWCPCVWCLMAQGWCVAGAVRVLSLADVCSCAVSARAASSFCITAAAGWRLLLRTCALPRDCLSRKQRVNGGAVSCRLVGVPAVALVVSCSIALT
jgi:hypothetical protein